MNYEGLYDISYRIIGDKPVIFLFTRNKQQQKKVIRVCDFKPYFYVNAKYSIAFLRTILPNYVEYEQVKQKTIFNESVVKCYTSRPSDLYYVKQVLSDYKITLQNIYESDILFDLRYAVDNVKEVEQTNYKILTIDIETDCEYGFPVYENPIEPIICVSIHDNYSSGLHTFVWREDLKQTNAENIHYYNNEKDMLLALIEYWRSVDADIIIGWNLQFDIKYLISRLKYLNIDYNKLCVLDDKFDIIRSRNIIQSVSINEPVRIRTKTEAEILGFVLFDLLRAYRKMHFGELTSYSLNSIASLELKESKQGIHNTGVMWRNDIESLISYNRKDVRLTYEINNKCKLIKIFDDIKRFAGVRNINDNFYASRIHETRMMKKYKDIYVFPTKQPFKEKNEDNMIKGALVREPEVGLHKGVVCMDAKSLYPSVIYTFNLSKEKINDNGVLINGTRIEQHPKGIMPSMIKELIDLKDKMKKEVEGTGQDLSDKMFAIKTFINSFYGINALSSFRLYDKRIAENITFLGREINIRCSELIKQNFGYDVIYGDTDSLFISIKSDDGQEMSTEQLVEKGKQIQQYINNNLANIVKDLGGDSADSTLFVEFEKVYKRIFFQLKSGKKDNTSAKKRYAGRIVWEDNKYIDKLKIAGMAARRSDVAEVSKTIQKRMFEMILKDKTVDEICEYIKSVVLDMYDRKINIDDCSIPVKLNKPTNQYKVQNTPKIRGVAWSNAHINTQFKAGTKFKMIYVLHPETTVVCFDDESQISNIKIDWHTMFDKCIYQKIKPTFSTLKWDNEYNSLVKYCEKLANKDIGLMQWCVK